MNFLAILGLIVPLLVFGQVEAKPVLYFAYDDTYILDRDQFPDSTYIYFKIKELQLKHKANTPGYIYLRKDSVAIRPVQDTILNLKQYVENENFYLPGKWNKLVSKQAFINNLVRPFEIRLVKGNEVIYPKLFKYNWFTPPKRSLPIGYVKDTLAFSKNAEWIEKTDPADGSVYFILWDPRINGHLYFTPVNNTCPETIGDVRSFNDFLQKAIRKGFLPPFGRDLSKHDLLKMYTIFLVDDESCLEVKARYSTH